jgi:hypothetical protein
MYNMKPDAILDWLMALPENAPPRRVNALQLQVQVLDMLGEEASKIRIDNRHHVRQWMLNDPLQMFAIISCAGIAE